MSSPLAGCNSDTVRDCLDSFLVVVLAVALSAFTVSVDVDEVAVGSLHCVSSFFLDGLAAHAPSS